MEFEYRLTGTGWAEARIADDTSHLVLTASYLSDALGDLLEAIGLLLEGVSEARCSWEEEPGEYRWIFVRTGDNAVQLNILDQRGVLVFSTTQLLGVFARAIADGAAATLGEYGEAGYLAEWVKAPFPTAHLAFIREQLSTPPWADMNAAEVTNGSERVRMPTHETTDQKVEGSTPSDPGDFFAGQALFFEVVASRL
jgi:hypothetical protein